MKGPSDPCSPGPIGGHAGFSHRRLSRWQPLYALSWCASTPFRVQESPVKEQELRQPVIAYERIVEMSSSERMVEMNSSRKLK